VRLAGGEEEGMRSHNPYDGLSPWLIELLRDRRKLSKRNISLLIVTFCRNKPQTDAGLAALIVYDRAKEIAEGKRYKDQREKANCFLDFLDKGLKRAYVQGELVDYTTYRKGQSSLMGNKIDYCPVCNRKGAIEPVYCTNGEVVHWGHTIHKTRPFFMGEESVERCEWPPGSR
jgi:hypothetical protein